MNRDLFLVAASLFLWGFGESAFIAYQPLYLQEFGADPIVIGGILGAFGIANAIAHIPAGYFADHFGRRPVMWFAWVLGVVSTWIMAFASHLSLFVVGLLIFGLTMFVIAPLNSYVTAARGKWSVGRALTSISASFNVGAIIGPLIGGYIGDHFGFRYIFLFAGCIFIASTIIIFLIRTQPVDQPIQGENGRKLFTNRLFSGFLVVYFLAMFAMFLPQPLSPNFLQNQANLSLQQIGQLYSISSIGIVSLNILLGSLNAGLGYILGQVFMLAFSLIMWQQTGLFWYGMAFFLLGGFRAGRMLAVAYIRSLVDVARMGLAYGISETVSSIAMILAPPLAGFLYNFYPSMMYAISAGLIGFTILISIIYISMNRTARVTDSSISAH
jgi:MFS family permease